ncbi:MAG: TonB-dependent receptor [Flavobacteriales bacterium]|nr:TonB-dependent receptor [Flavobacteriales bacterium]MDP7430160.1 TonB-dependent receptor [Flavobacteriales bacterium]HJN64557.1 TonB-dependent receptor [Flavobacteriales bacterium]
MFNKRNCMSVLLTIPFIGFAQQLTDSVQIKKVLNEVNVNALRAGDKTPVAFTNINQQEIEKGNLGQDLPYIISLTPSVVTTSDAGAGVGYTGFRVRGSDATRINVTVNGIPLNDSESQGVWWVNMPDFSSSVENIQIQRGVGTSTNGASAFGASVNLKTDGLRKNAYLLSNNTLGSFATFKNNIEFGTGLLNNKFAFDGRLSKISSDGYMDRATSNLKSLYLQGTYFGESSVIKALMFTGHERTYQAWYGIPINYLDTSRAFNPYTYDNEVDDYEQTHYQLHYSKQMSETTNYNIAAHYTHGEGYYEQEKLGEDLVDYGLENIILSSDTITSTNLIRRKWLNNDFAGLTFSLTHKMGNIDLILGGAGNRYSGQHYGNIIWTQYASNANFNHLYYWNKAEKLDHNFYVKANYKYSDATNLYADLQRRRIDYTFQGKDEDGNTAQQEVALTFFNPKFGLFHMLNENQAIYASFAVANKEPNRNDYVESTPNSRPEHETLYDTEVGYKQSGEKLSLGINIYQMNYKNQLVLTGQINDVGANTRTNIDKSFRRGVELEGSLSLGSNLKWSGNMTLSQNKITNYTAYIDNWDNGGQEKVDYGNTDLAFSPSVIWASQFMLKLNAKIHVDLISKYVGEQFIDNTSSKDRMLDDYLVNNLRIAYKWNSKIFKTVKLTLQVNNLLNNEYVSNAWVYRFISDGWDPRGSDPYVNTDSERGYNMAAYFPEATRNYLLGLTLGF